MIIGIRDSKRIVLSVVVSMLFIFNGAIGLTAGLQNQMEANSGFEIPELLTSFNYEITVVFLGINESRIDTTDVIERLPSWYAPIDGMCWRSDYDEEFSLSYNIVIADEEEVSDYRTFIYDNSVENRSPIFIQPEHPLARYVGSSETEDYLTSNVAEGSSATLVIIDTFTFDPAGHTPYYYNATYNELDAELQGFTSIPIPWASTYQIAGGGEDSRLLWLDLSAGPTVYHSYMDSVEGGVEEVRPIWEYPSLYNPQESLTKDIVKYIAQAIECRFLPSIGFRAGYAYEEVRFEVLLVDLADTELSFEEMIDLDYIVSEYKRVFPFVNWTYFISEWDYESDPDSTLFFELWPDEASMTYDPRLLMDFLDERYTFLVNESTTNQLVIPIFLFLIPEGWGFSPDWGGFARHINGEFAYIYGKQSHAYVDPEYVWGQTIPLTGLKLENGTNFMSSGDLGTSYTKLTTTLEVHNGTVSVHFLDEYGFNQFNQALTFESLLQNPMNDVINASGIISSQDELRILGQYYLIIENLGDTNATIDLEIELSVKNYVGYTWKIMHEAGHALGLNHPHDAYSYGNYDHPSASAGIYLNWLWDMSYSQMNYANEAPTISIMDIDTLQREATPRMWADGLLSMSGIVENATRRFGHIPSQVMELLENASTSFEQSVTHYSDYSNLANYNQSILAAYEMWCILTEAVYVLETTPTGIPLVIIVAGSGGVVVLLIALTIFMKKRE
ncbi:MAG: M66 family metalloprotease [Candidatus Thorarchaeota archaeon]